MNDENNLVCQLIVNTSKYSLLFEYEFWEWGVRISEVQISEGLLYTVKEQTKYKKNGARCSKKD